MRQPNDGLYELLQDLPNDIVMLEVGVYRGESTSIFLSSGKIKTIHCVDPWQNGYDVNDIASYHTDMSIIENEFRQRAMHDGRIVIHKNYSTTVANLMKNEELDFVYIDGAHTYDRVIDDIRAFLPKIKKNGLIGGHDYDPGWPGVVRAVNQIFGQPDKVFRDGSWLKKLG